jgi:hypothetical protein
MMILFFIDGWVERKEEIKEGESEINELKWTCDWPFSIKFKLLYTIYENIIQNT